MIATTIMISTRVKAPRRLLSLVNIALSCFLFYRFFDCASEAPAPEGRLKEHSQCQLSRRLRISRKLRSENLLKRTIPQGLILAVDLKGKAALPTDPNRVT